MRHRVKGLHLKLKDRWSHEEHASAQCRSKSVMATTILLMPWYPMAPKFAPPAEYITISDQNSSTPMDWWHRQGNVPEFETPIVRGRPGKGGSIQDQGDASAAARTLRQWKREKESTIPPVIKIRRAIRKATSDYHQDRQGGFLRIV